MVQQSGTQDVQILLWHRPPWLCLKSPSLCDKWRIRILFFFFFYWMGCHCSIVWPRVSNKQDYIFWNWFKTIRIEKASSLLSFLPYLPLANAVALDLSACDRKKRHYWDILKYASLWHGAGSKESSWFRLFFFCSLCPDMLIQQLNNTEDIDGHW